MAEAAIAHLLENPGLEPTPQELEALFDLAEEDNGEGAKGLSSAGNDAQPRLGVKTNGRRKGAQHRRGRDADSGLLLFLRRCGQRRSERPCRLVFGI